MKALNYLDTAIGNLEDPDFTSRPIGEWIVRKKFQLNSIEGKLCLQDILGISYVKKIEGTFEEKDEDTKELMIIGYKDLSGGRQVKVWLIK